MLSTVLGLIVILPAFAHQTKLDAVRERVQQIYDFPALDDELKTEQEQAVINAGIIPVLDRAAEVERVLQDHIDFALGFGTFSQNALYLAELFLGQSERFEYATQAPLHIFTREAKTWVPKVPLEP